jgi:hypothetical protein
MQKLLFFDLETSPTVSYHWHGKHEQEIIEIIEEPYILTFAYKFKGGGVKASSLLDFSGDKETKKRKLVEKLHEVMSSADVVVAHNGNQFDCKWANTEFVHYNLAPIKPVKQIDTLTIARGKFNFNSNHLNDLGKFLGLGQKVETGGFQLWKGVMNLDRGATRKMVKYNKNDVCLLEKVYEKLVPWATNTPYLHEGMVCPKCGGSVQFRGAYVTKTQRGKRYQCSSCGSWGVSNKHLNIKSEFVK